MKVNKVIPDPMISMIQYRNGKYTLCIHGVTQKFIRLVLNNGVMYALTKSSHGTHFYEMSVASSYCFRKACGKKEIAKIYQYLVDNGAYLAFYPLPKQLIK